MTRKRLPALPLALALLLPAAQATEPAPPSFPDVPADVWYAEDVGSAAKLGLLSGKEDGSFDPMGQLTLAEAVTLGATLLSMTSDGSFTPGGDPWYQNALDYLVDQGMFFPNETMDFDAPAHRSDLAGLIGRAMPSFSYARINRVAFIPDVPHQADNAELIYLLYQAGILTGGPDGSFHPNDPITRAEAATILVRAAMPTRRRHFTLEAPAPGRVVSSYDGTSFRLSLPEGWSLGPNPGADSFSQANCTTNGAAFFVYRYDKTDLLTNYPDLLSFAQRHLAAGIQTAADMEQRSDLLLRTFRGHVAYVATVLQTDGTTPMLHTLYYLETGDAYYAVALLTYLPAQPDTLDQLWSLAYSLDLEL